MSFCWFFPEIFCLLPSDSGAKFAFLLQKNQMAHECFYGSELSWYSTDSKTSSPHTFWNLSFEKQHPRMCLCPFWFAHTHLFSGWFSPRNCIFDRTRVVFRKKFPILFSCGGSVWIWLNARHRTLNQVFWWINWFLWTQKQIRLLSVNSQFETHSKSQSITLLLTECQNCWGNACWSLWICNITVFKSSPIKNLNRLCLNKLTCPGRRTKIYSCSIFLERIQASAGPWFVLLFASKRYF